MDTNLYWGLRGNYEERKAKLAAQSREYLEAAILDSEYNEFLRSRSNYREGETQLRPGGKRIPYIGWFWRHVNFSDLERIPVGDCGEFKGFMPRNKWDYPERYLTLDEAKQVMAIIDAAMKANEQGGLLDNIIKETNAELDKLWEFFAGLEI